MKLHRLLSVADARRTVTDLTGVFSLPVFGMVFLEKSGTLRSIALSVQRSR